MRPSTILFTLHMFLVTSGVFAQSELKITKSDNTRLIYVLNEADLIAENSKEWLSIRIYKVSNGAGSAGFANGEASHNLLIAVSEIGEAPDQSLFEIGPYINPEVAQWIEEKEYEKTLEIDYGTNDSRKTLRLKATLDEVKIDKKGKN
ncbi:MAG: hypothetical protein ABJC55_15115 [Algoriphagus sp.]